MGEIRKDNLHESLIEELNELANIDLSGKQDKTDESLLTESKDVIGAINELFQSANNGKELIADAIGEPLSSEDTFSAMSTDINGLLSQFKTNMMNNGITVESNDKFKSLIEKIALLADSEGKGIQYATGIIDTSITSECTIDTNLNFSPNIIFVTGCNMRFSYTNNTYTRTNTGLVLSNLNDTMILGSFTNTAINMTVNINNITQDSFIITPHFNNLKDYSLYLNSWYAIGVGEEDTTLRDSLASILQEEGVSVTEEDDMASLIGKTDNQFNSLNTTITLLNNQVNSLTSELSGKVTPAGTAVAGNVLTGKTFINSTGQVVTGTMANQGAKTFTPSASKQTGAAGYYSSITVNTDSNLVAANIISGKKIFGVTGTAVVGKKLTASDTVIMGSQYYKNGNKIVNDVINFTILESDNKPLQVLPCFFTGSVRIKTSMWVNYSRSGSTSKLYFKLVRGTTVVKTSSTYTATYDDNYGASKAISISYDMTGIQPGDVIQMYGFTNYSSADYKGACYPMSICGTIS